VQQGETTHKKSKGARRPFLLSGKVVLSVLFNQENLKKIYATGDDE
jgi:hypothetical protein